MKTDTRFSAGLLSDVPWWVFFLVSGGVYTAMTVLYPWLSSAFYTVEPVPYPDGLPELVSSGCLVPLVLSSWRKRKNGAQLSIQETIQYLNDHDWNSFSDIISVTFVKMGFTVLSQPVPATPSSFLIKVIKGGQVTLIMLVRDQITGVKSLRDLVDAMVTEGVDNSVMISTGLFSGPARRYAKKIPIELLDGVGLMILLGSQTGTVDRSVSKSGDFSGIKSWVMDKKPLCPLCHSTMILDFSGKQERQGKTAWLCCRHRACPGRYDYALDQQFL